MIKKIISVVLIVLTVAGLFCSCGKKSFSFDNSKTNYEEIIFKNRKISVKYLNSLNMGFTGVLSTSGKIKVEISNKTNKKAKIKVTDFVFNGKSTEASVIDTSLIYGMNVISSNKEKNLLISFKRSTKTIKNEVNTLSFKICLFNPENNKTIAQTNKITIKLINNSIFDSENK